MKLTLSLAIIFVVVGIEAKSLPEDLENVRLNCFIDHLKHNNLLDAEYPKNKEPLNLVKDCERMISTVRDETYKKFALILRKEKSLNKHTKCIMKKFRTEKWFDLMMKIMVFEGANHFSEEEKKLKVAAANKETDDVLERTGSVCIHAKEFGKLFDSFFKSDSSSEEEDDDPAEEYCVKKYIIDKNLVDNSEFKIELNATNIDVANLDCDAIVVKGEKDFYDEMRKFMAKNDSDEEETTVHQVDCVMIAYRHANVFDKALAIVALSELKITDEQRIKERERFIHAMLIITTSLSSCTEEN